jgi:hypothetical protein
MQGMMYVFCAPVLARRITTVAVSPRSAMCGMLAATRDLCGRNSIRTALVCRNRVLAKRIDHVLNTIAINRKKLVTNHKRELRGGQ